MCQLTWSRTYKVMNRCTMDCVTTPTDPFLYVTETVTTRPREHDTVQGAVSHLFDLYFGRFEQAQ